MPRTAIQRANALLGATRNATRIVGPAVAGLLVAGVGGGWAVAVDALAYLVAAACLSRLRLSAPVRAAGATMLRDLREGWDAFRSRTWVWVGSSSFALINLVHAGVWGVLGPVIAEDTIGAASWGVVLSAMAAGFLVSSIVMYRVTFTHLLGVGQAFLVLGGLPLRAARPRRPDPGPRGRAPSSAARAPACTGSRTRRRSRSTCPGSRCRGSASIDSMASLVTVPLGQLAVIPVAAAFGDPAVAVAGGVVFAAVAALDARRPADPHPAGHETAVGRDPAGRRRPRPGHPGRARSGPRTGTATARVGRLDAWSRCAPRWRCVVAAWGAIDWVFLVVAHATPDITFFGPVEVQTTWLERDDAQRAAVRVLDRRRDRRWSAR